MRTPIPALLLVLASIGQLHAAPRVIEVDGDHVVLQLAPEDDVRPDEAATLFFARQLPKQRVEVHVAEIRVLSCTPTTCRAVVTRQQQPVRPGYEMILHRVRETRVAPGVAASRAGTETAVDVAPGVVDVAAGVVAGIASLRVTGAPADAIVRIDQAVACEQVPCSKDLVAGPHALRVERDGFVPFEGSVVIEAGRVTGADVHLEHRPVVEVVSMPAGALVQLDGDEVGTTPIAFALERVEAARVAITLDGYEYQELEVLPRPNETLRLSPVLIAKRPVPSEAWRVTGIVSASVGVALATAGGVLMFLGDHESQRADDLHQHYLALPPGGPSTAYVDAWLDVEHAVDRSRLYGRSGAAMLGAGGGLVLFGVLAWLDPFDWFADSVPMAAPSPDGHGAVLDWRMTW